MGKLFTRRARFGKTVEAAGRTLIGKQGEDLFIYLSIFFWRSQSTYECDLQNKRFSPRFSFQFCTVKAYCFENHCHLWSLKEKKIFRSIHGGSLSFCKCWRARIKEPTGRSLPMSALSFIDITDSHKRKIVLHFTHMFSKNSNKLYTS